MKLTRDFYRPKQYTAKITPKGIDAEIYLVNYADKPGAIGFGGRRSKPDFNFSFRSEDKRAEYIKNYIESAKKSLDSKLEREGKLKGFKHNLKVGDILYSSWGYDQTNIDFYQVTEVIGDKSVKIRAIASKLDHAERGADYIVAIPDKFLNSKTMLKRVQQGNCIKIASYAYAYPWDGQPRYETASGWGH